MPNNSTAVLSRRANSIFENSVTDTIDESVNSEKEEAPAIGEYIISAEETGVSQESALAEEEVAGNNKDLPKISRQSIELMLSDYILEHYLKRRNIVRNKFNESYYSDVKEYHGLVETVDEEHGKFTVVLHPKEHPDELIQTEFDFDDVGSKSDLELIAPGVAVIWLFGYEMQNGGGNRRHFSRLIIRRTKVLTRQEKAEADKEADEWYEFFRHYTTEE